MKNLISILTLLFLATLWSCQSDTKTQQSSATTNTSAKNESASAAKKPLDVSVANSDQNAVVKDNPMSADKNSKVIDLGAIKQPEVKSVGSTKKKETKSSTTPKPSKTKTTSTATKVQEVAKPSAPKTHAVDIKDIEITQPKVVEGKVKNTPPPPPPPPKKEPVVTTTSAPKATPTKQEIPKEKEVPLPAPFSHDSWDKLLRSNVSASGVVNYKGFKSNESKLDAYLKLLADNPIQSSWARNKKMAYWINAYNAFTVKLILDNYPLSKITDLHGGKPWDKKWIKLGNETYSLNNIENDILRPQYKDARIHFAVNCAAKSCPPILNKAWTASRLESNFDHQAKAFINNSTFNEIGADKVVLSKIFEWYAADFGDLITYINKFSSTKVNPGAQITYKEYNWNLNE